MTVALIGWGAWGWALALTISALSGLAVSELMFAAFYRPPGKKRKKK